MYAHTHTYTYIYIYIWQEEFEIFASLCGRDLPDSLCSVFWRKWMLPCVIWLILYLSHAPRDI